MRLRRTYCVAWVAACGWLVLVASGPVQATLPGQQIALGDKTIRLQEVAGGMSSPVYVTNAGDGSGRLFVVDQIGLIRVIRNGVLLETPFLDIRDRLVSLNEFFDERGLLGLAFHPEYEENGRFFVRYSTPREGDPAESCNDPEGFIVGCHTSVLSEFSATDDPNVADPDSERVLFTVDQPEFNHDGGHIDFGPDGFLYVALGDGGGRDDGLSSEPPAHGPDGHGQNTDTALGSILRIDVDVLDGDLPYGIPADNPFVGADGLDEIYAYGFRNPYRFSFDRGGSNELFCGDVGQDLFEEVDVVVNGGNYGWAIREGAHCFDPADPSVPPKECSTEGLIDPIFDYNHLDGLSVVGGYVYRGPQFPSIHGLYVFADFSVDFGPSGRIFHLDADGDRSQAFEFSVDPPVELVIKGLGEDEDGELYVVGAPDLGPFGESGSVYRIHAVNPQVPGDCNQDGMVDVADAICVFNALFDGTQQLPCGAGNSSDLGNLQLFDWQPDGMVDVSDGIGLLLWLFDSGSAHPLEGGGACVPIGGCPVMENCP